MKPVDFVNSLWRAERPERGHFEIARLSHQWGWVFKPEPPILDNTVGYEDDFESEEQALAGLQRFVRRHVR